MSEASAVLGVKPPAPPRGADCRVYERYPCDLETACQPPAARADRSLRWSARIRDISLGGIGLIYLAR